jgi:hypothetical protein
MKARERAVEAVREVAAVRGKDLRRTVKKEFATVRDELLVEAGKAAERRLAARARRRALVRAGTAAALAGAGIAAVVATRAAVKRARGKKS